MTKESNENFNINEKGKSKMAQTQSKPVSIRIQQNMAELLQNVFFEAKSIDDLEKLFDKSRSSVYRLIRGITEVYPVLSISMDENFHTYLKLNNCLNESEIDRAFAKNRELPLVYILLKGLIREKQEDELTLQEIKEKLGLSSEKEAVKIRNLVLNTTYLGAFQIDDSDPWWDEEVF